MSSEYYILAIGANAGVNKIEFAYVGPIPS